MRDPFAAHRLPDLPNAGYSTAKEKAVSDIVMHFIRAVERNRLILLKIVIDGPHKWRKTAGGKWRGAHLDTEFLDAIFGYLVLLAGDDPQSQYEHLIQMRLAPSPFLRAPLDPEVERKRVMDSLAFVDAVKKGYRKLGGWGG